MKPDTGIRKRFEYSANSVAGVRPVNEDAWCVTPVDEGLICAVADGIGGHEAGDVASALAIRIFGETVRDTIREKKRDISGETSREKAWEKVQETEQGTQNTAAGDHETAAEILKRAHTLAHEGIREQAIGTARAGMGTTLVSAWFTNETVSLCNTGDSRCTLIRTGTVRPLTKDHSLVQTLADRGFIAPEEAASHPMKNVITHSLGADFIADCTVHPICRGDTLVISSDGLHDYVSPVTMIAAGDAQTAEEGVRILMEEAGRTSKDNITLIVVRVHDDVTGQEQNSE